MRLPAALWVEHREITEKLAQVMVEAAKAETKAEWNLSNVASFEPEVMLRNKPTPIRAYVANIKAPLSDVIIVLSSLGQERVEQILSVMLHKALASLGINKDIYELFSLEDVVEFESVEEAINETDALYLEASYGLSTTLDDLRIIFGSLFVESVARYLSGEVEVVAPPPVITEPSEELHSTELESDTSALDLLDQQLQQQEVVAAQRKSVQKNSSSSGANRWAPLLSGVEVDISAELGRTNLALGDAVSLNGESILTLDQSVDEPVKVYVNGVEFATARLVIVDGEYGIEILEILAHKSIALQDTGITNRVAA